MAKVITAPFKAIGKLFAPKTPKAPQALPVPTINAAQAAAMREDSLRRRRGARANDFTKGGAEPSTLGGATLLGGGQ